MSVVLRVVLPPGALQTPKDIKDHKKPQNIKFKTSLTVKEAIEDIIRSLKLKQQPDQVRTCGKMQFLRLQILFSFYF